MTSFFSRAHSSPHPICSSLYLTPSPNHLYPRCIMLVVVRDIIFLNEKELSRNMNWMNGCALIGH